MTLNLSWRHFQLQWTSVIKESFLERSACSISHQSQEQPQTLLRLSYANRFTEFETLSLLSTHISVMVPLNFSKLFFQGVVTYFSSSCCCCCTVLKEHFSTPLSRLKPAGSSWSTKSAEQRDRRAWSQLTGCKPSYNKSAKLTTAIQLLKKRQAQKLDCSWSKMKRWSPSTDGKYVYLVLYTSIPLHLKILYILTPH